MAPMIAYFALFSFMRLFTRQDTRLSVGRGNYEGGQKLGTVFEVGDVFCFTDFLSGFFI